MFDSTDFLFNLKVIEYGNEYCNMSNYIFDSLFNQKFIILYIVLKVGIALSKDIV